MFKKKFLSLFLLLVTNNLSEYSDSSYTRFNKLKKKSGGNDERYINTSNNSTDDSDNSDKSNTKIMLYKIRRHIINKNIIEELEKNSTNINNKLHIIEKYTDIHQNQNKISGFNLLAGNLLNEFNYF